MSICKPEDKVAVIFVASYNSLRPGGGGVQICTADYMRLLELAGFELHTVSFESDRRFFTRVLRKLEGRPLLRLIPPTLSDEIAAEMERTGARLVFFNLLDYPTVAHDLRKRFGSNVRLIHLSHGLDSTDICIDEQVRRHAAGAHDYDGRAARRLGGKLHFEADYHRYLDAALCLSPLDAELERWLGARRTAWFSRPIRETPLNPKPVNRRVGCVATLDHRPNYHGLIELFESLATGKGQSLSVRLVGGPVEPGQEMAARFSFVEYLGRLSDEQLRREAETWSCFVHPIFHYARGCSTKLAVALGWGLPIATTVAGARGYVWDETTLPLAATPKDLAAMVFAGGKASDFIQRRERSLQIAALQPTDDKLATQMRRFILFTDAAVPA
jgi:glycosyltransferase involved in cell wall biosynthesis